MTTALETEPKPETRKGVVQLKILNGRVKTLDFQEGQTARHYLEAEGVTLKKDETLNVDSELATPDTPIEPNAVLTVVPKVQNG